MSNTIKELQALAARLRQDADLFRGTNPDISKALDEQADSIFKEFGPGGPIRTRAAPNAQKRPVIDVPDPANENDEDKDLDEEVRMVMARMNEVLRNSRSPGTNSTPLVEVKERDIEPGGTGKPFSLKGLLGG